MVGFYPRSLLLLALVIFVTNLYVFREGGPVWLLELGLGLTLLPVIIGYANWLQRHDPR